MFYLIHGVYGQISKTDKIGIISHQKVAICILINQGSFAKPLKTKSLTESAGAM